MFLGFGGFVTSLRMAGAGQREAGMTGGAVGGAGWAGGVKVIAKVIAPNHFRAESHQAGRRSEIP